MRESSYRPLLVPIAWLVLLSLVWGSTWVGDQLISGQGSPIALTGVRYGLAAFMLYMVALCRWFIARKRPHALVGVLSRLNFHLDDESVAPPTRIGTAVQLYRLHLRLGACMFAFPSLLLIWAGHLGAAAYTPLVYSAMPMILLIAQAELRAPSIVAVGAMLVLLNGTVPLSPVRLAGALPAFAAVLLQAWSLLYVRRHLRAATSPWGIGTQLALAACVLAGASVALEAPQRLAPLLQWNASAIIAIAALAGLGTAVAYPLYYRLLHSLDPAQLTTSAWLQTLVAVAEGALLLRQKPSLGMFAGAVGLMVCTSMLFTMGSRRSRIGSCRVATPT